MIRDIRQDKLATRLNLFWIGLAFFVFGYALPDILMFSIIGKLTPYLNLLGVLFIIGGLFCSISWNKTTQTRLGRIIVCFLIFWHLFMALHREASDLLARVIYSDPYNYTLYLYPLLLLIPVFPLVRSFYRVSKWLMFASIPLLCLTVMYYTNFGAIQFVFEGFVMGAAFILMTSRYHSRNLLLSAAGILAFSFLIATITARRNLMMTTMLYLLGGAYMILFRSHKVSKSTQIFAIMSGVVVALAGTVFFLMNSTGIFSTIVARSGDDTRSYVFLLFFWDLLQTPLDMIIGRGIRGTYECQGVEGPYRTMRSVVENGYLQLLLKGGIIYIVAYITTFITAICKAWRSRNQLCRAAIIILTVQLIDMIPFGLHAVNLKTFMIWMCVSICLCPSVWNMTDEELRDELTEKKHQLPQWNNQ